ncbi:DUF6412 domain-containing protein [Actinorugispora endophytica]|uniref:Uncharacterized protein n=1 Tax=Actinorugispora endophytica TaxID=1605990 RepID=A0A4R6V8Y3_9ACTN|nr:DUF6412 domain-containing protein [Actinorugispora endophytica]TDQ55248.1 hypothetical protein EV190_101573 [Actinorugispora endophytica]
MDFGYALLQVLFFGLDGTQLGVGSLATVLAVLAVGAAVVWITAHGYGVRPLSETEIHARRGAMRRRERRAGAIVSRDPDASGKPRPRAPGAA